MLPQVASVVRFDFIDWIRPQMLTVFANRELAWFGCKQISSARGLIRSGELILDNGALIQVVPILRIDHRHFSQGISNLLG